MTRTGSTYVTITVDASNVTEALRRIGISANRAGRRVAHRLRAAEIAVAQENPIGPLVLAELAAFPEALDAIAET